MADSDQTETTRNKAWIDLCDPTPQDVRDIKERFGIDVPDLTALREIESSSRLRTHGQTLIMTAPLLTRTADERWQYAPTGFLLLPEVLITVHYAHLPAFDAIDEAMKREPDLTPPVVLVRLLEEVVDRAADKLEAASEMATAISRTVFYSDIDRHGLNRETAVLRRSIIKLGRASDLSSRVRYSFLSIGRMASFVIDRCEVGLDGNVRTRFQSVLHDIDSLDEFEISLSTRIQFLLDAATSLISIRQNDVVKVLTVASVVGIPPVMVVGIYGMNFKVMPELSWPLGYPFALFLCVLSALIPYFWFKLKKWV